MKTERFEYRLTPRYKRYLSEMAAAKGLKLGQLVNDWIRRHFWDFLQETAGALTRAEVLRSHGVEMTPEAAVRYWKETWEAYPKEVRIEYAKEYLAAYDRIFDELVRKSGYQEHEAQLAELNAEDRKEPAPSPRPRVPSRKRTRRSAAR